MSELNHHKTISESHVPIGVLKTMSELY